MPLIIKRVNCDRVRISAASQLLSLLYLHELSALAQLAASEEAEPDWRYFGKSQESGMPAKSQTCDRHRQRETEPVNCFGGAPRRSNLCTHAYHRHRFHNCYSFFFAFREDRNWVRELNLRANFADVASTRYTLCNKFRHTEAHTASQRTFFPLAGIRRTLELGHAHTCTYAKHACARAFAYFLIHGHNVH